MKIEELEKRKKEIENEIVNWALIITKSSPDKLDHRINRIENRIKLRRGVDNKINKYWINYKKENVLE